MENQDLLPRKARIAVYTIAVIGAVIAPFIAVTSPEYAQATIVAVSVLEGAAGVTALTHVNGKQNG